MKRIPSLTSIARTRGVPGTVNGSAPKHISLNCPRSRSCSRLSSCGAVSTKSRNFTNPLPQRSNFYPLSLVRHASSTPTSATPPARTALYGLHLQHGAKMVPFGGYAMSVQYSDLSIAESHKWTRKKASLFDVGHMVQHHISGPSAAAFLETMTPTDISALKPHTSTLSVLLHPKTGGIVDDTVISRLHTEEDSVPKYYVVTNAGCRAKDLAYLSSQLSRFSKPDEVSHTVLDNHGLIALQGPLSATILSVLLPTSPSSSPLDLQSLFFGSSLSTPLLLPSGSTTSSVLISRGGYTGEDGFEISISPQDTIAVTNALLETAGPEKLRLAGLGARDSLRLEAGMCLYGHDLDDNTTPVEAGLSWVIPKSRRTPAGATFHGAETILSQLTPKKDGGTGVMRRRVGLIVEGAPAREGAHIVDENGAVVGKVTSGCPSPSLGANIAMGYVRSGMQKVGTEVGILVRGKRRGARVVKMPFVETRYWRG